MDFNGQFTLDDDSIPHYRYRTPTKSQLEADIFSRSINPSYLLFLDPEINPNSTTQTFKKTIPFYNPHILELPKIKNIFDSSPNSKRWSLKQISARIVEELKKQPCSHDEIISKLVEEMLTEYGQQQDKQKEVQNLRRRAYDALNVLISLGLLVKNKKLLQFVKNSDLNVSKQNLLKKKEKSKQELIAKKQEASKIIEKEKCLNQLINLNKQRLNDQKVYFPFLLAHTNISKQDEDELILEYGQNQLQVFSKNPLEVTGDLNVVLKLFKNKQILC